MALYLDQTCPTCGGYFGVVTPGPERKSNRQPINGVCAGCGYQLRWQLICGGYNRQKSEYWPRIRKRLTDCEVLRLYYGSILAQIADGRPT